MNQISSTTLRRVVLAANMHRQYTVSVGRDLFGTPIVTCRWGQIGRAVTPINCYAHQLDKPLADGV